MFGQVDPALVPKPQAVVARMALPINRSLAELKLMTRQPSLADAPAELQRLHDSPVAVQRPGLQLHAAALAGMAARGLGDAVQADAWVARCAPFDLAASEAGQLLAAASAPDNETEPGSRLSPTTP